MTIAAKGFLYDHDRATGVATITLNRPERLNALTFEIYEELRDAFTALEREPGVRAVVLTGTGRGFCSGGDFERIIGELLKLDMEGLVRFTRLTGSLILAIRRLSRPVVAAVNGVAAGAGAAIAAACDFRIASEDARIGFPFAKAVGLAGTDMGVSWLLPRIVGLGRAAELLMTGEFVTAQEAERIGLYHRVVPKAEVPAEARSWAEKLARGPSLALGITKDLLNRETAMDLAAAIETEAEAQAICMAQPNFREAYEAFRAKREPRFT